MILRALLLQILAELPPRNSPMSMRPSWPSAAAPPCSMQVGRQIRVHGPVREHDRRERAASGAAESALPLRGIFTMAASSSP